MQKPKDRLGSRGNSMCSRSVLHVFGASKEGSARRAGLQERNSQGQTEMRWWSTSWTVVRTLDLDDTWHSDPALKCQLLLFKVQRAKQWFRDRASRAQGLGETEEIAMLRFWLHSYPTVSPHPTWISFLSLNWSLSRMGVEGQTASL